MPIARLRGRVLETGADWLIVEVGGLGILASVPGKTAEAAAEGAPLALYTHLHVREDALTLYGFTTREDLVLFEQLISVSGVGPRVGLALVSALDAVQLAAAIIEGRSDLLRKVPGVGQKTAERIVLDLRDKVAPVADGGDGATSAAAAADVDGDVVAALMALGYTQAEARSAAAASTEAGQPLEERIRAALQSFARAG